MNISVLVAQFRMQFKREGGIPYIVFKNQYTCLRLLPPKRRVCYVSVNEQQTLLLLLMHAVLYGTIKSIAQEILIKQK